MNLSDFDYFLPERLVAQTPLECRDKSRLMCINRVSGDIEHRSFRDILDYMQAGDCLVLNDSRVIPARLFAKKRDTGAYVEVFLLRPMVGADTWECLVKPGKKARCV